LVGDLRVVGSKPGQNFRQSLTPGLPKNPTIIPRQNLDVPLIIDFEGKP